MRYLLPMVVLMGGAFYAGAELARVAAERREREREAREEVNLALGRIACGLADLERRTGNLEEVAHDHEGLVAAANQQPAMA